MEIERRSGIKCYERSIENVLSSVLVTSDFWKIVKDSEEVLVLVSDIINVLEEKGYLEETNGKISLTDKGKQLIESMKLYEKTSFECDSCEGRGISIEEHKDLLKEFMRYHEKRPKPIRKYDQGFVTPSTTIARISFMMEKGDLGGKRIIVLGDDDLVSIAAALSGYPKEIAVIEIDSRITDFISKAAKEIGFDIQIHERDLREPLPSELVGRFHTFFTDPPETLKALQLFIGRGITSLIGERCSGYFGLTRVEASLEKWREIQRILLDDFKVVITDIIRSFNKYMNWDYIKETKAWNKSTKWVPEDIWYTSYLYRIETLSGTKSRNERVDEDIYQDVESSTS